MDINRWEVNISMAYCTKCGKGIMRPINMEVRTHYVNPPMKPVKIFFDEKAKMSSEDYSKNLENWNFQFQYCPFCGVKL